MNSDTRLTTTDVPPARGGAGAALPASARRRERLTVPAVAPDKRRAAPAQAAGNFNAVRFVHEALRGRYLLTAVGVILGAGGFAALGWKSARPIYQSESLVQIKNELPDALGDQNRVLGGMLETFMQSQRMLISSRRVIDMAVQDPGWKASGIVPPADPGGYFSDALTVTAQPRSEFISITVKDTDPATAAAAVTGIANAYKELYDSQEKQLERQRIGVLEDRQVGIERRVQQLNQDIAQAAKEYGTTDLTVFYTAAAARLARLDTALAELRIEIAATGQSPANAPGAAQANSAPTTNPAVASQPRRSEELSPEQIALNDPTMRNYLDTLTGIERDLSQLEARGLGQGHTEVATTRRALEHAQVRVRRYAETWRASQAAAAVATVALPGVGSPGAAPVTPPRSLADLRANEAILLKLQKETQDELVVLGTKQMNLRRLGTDLENATAELGTLNRNIGRLRANGQLGGRLQIISTGEIPLSPAKDPRIKMAGAYGLIGACLPVGAMLLLSLVSRRYRYFDETEADVVSKTALLGILPVLRHGQPDGQEMTSAAHCLHQMRVTLRAQAPRGDSCTYLVTSTTAGEGKTSLTLSLGLAFVAARLRTLVIDADLVGRQLTRGLDASQFRGVSDALEAGSLRRLVRRMPEGLYVLGAGGTGAHDACGLSPAKVKVLLDEARKHFDVVLVDTGPILGSVEAAVLAPEVDGVIFTITRGQQRGLVQKALARLDALNATVAGVVFNRAHPNDFRSSPFGSGASSPSVDPDPRPAPLSKTPRFARFGPLVHAVAAAMPAEQN